MKILAIATAGALMLASSACGSRSDQAREAAANATPAAVITGAPAPIITGMPTTTATPKPTPTSSRSERPTTPTVLATAATGRTAPPEPPTASPSPSRTMPATTRNPASGQRLPLTRSTSSPWPTVTYDELDNEPDGRAGWWDKSSKGGIVISACASVVHPASQEGAPSPYLKLEVGTATWKPGTVTRLRVPYTITNTSERTAKLSVTGRAQVVDVPNAMYPSDFSMGLLVKLGPGEQYQGAASVLVADCGDTSSDPQAGLPAGSYRVGVEIKTLEAGRWYATSAPFTVG